VLNCQHHIQWVRQVPGGLHQCILCTQVVTKKDVQPKLEDLPEEFSRRWDAHEATRPPAAEAPAPPKPPAAKPPAAEAPLAAAAQGATPAATPTPTPTTPLAPIPRAPPPSRVSPSASAIPYDPASQR